MTRTKTNIRIVIQNTDENGETFAARLEGICDALAQIFLKEMDGSPFVVMTSDSTGRQTATILFMTSKEERNKLTFMFELGDAYNEYKKENKATEETDNLIEFLKTYN